MYINTKMGTAFDGVEPENPTDIEKQYANDLKFRELTIGIDNLLMAKRYADCTYRRLMTCAKDISQDDPKLAHKYNIDLHDIHAIKRGSYTSEMDNINRVGDSKDKDIADVLTILNHPEIDDMSDSDRMRAMDHYRRESQQEINGLDGNHIEQKLMSKLPDYMVNSNHVGESLNDLPMFNTTDLSDPANFNSKDYKHIMKPIADIDDSVTHIDNYLKKQIGKYAEEKGIDGKEMYQYIDSNVIHMQQEVQDRSTAYYNTFDGFGNIDNDQPIHQAYRAYQGYHQRVMPNEHQRTVYEQNIDRAIRDRERHYFGADLDNARRTDVLFVEQLQRNPKTRIDDPQELQQKLTEYMKMPVEERCDAYEDLCEKNNMIENKQFKELTQAVLDHKRQRQERQKDLYNKKNIHNYKNAENEDDLVDENGRVLTNDDSIVALLKAAVKKGFYDAGQMYKKREADIQLQAEELQLGISSINDTLERFTLTQEKKIEKRQAKKQARQAVKEYQDNRQQRRDDYESVVDAIQQHNYSELNEEQLDTAKKVTEYRKSSESRNLDENDFANVKPQTQTKKKKRRKKKRRSRSNDGPEL